MQLPAEDRIFQIEVTTQCNLKCEGCSRTVGIKANTWKNEHMPVETFRRAVACARPAQAIILQGIGEPTLHPDLPELISIAKESGKFRTISFYTNGLARSMDYYDDLARRGHNLVTVSVDSLRQEVADVCRKGTDVKKLLQRLCELYYTHKPNMNISLVLSRKNLFDCFHTLALLQKIAEAGGEPITVFIQKMLPTSPEIERDWVLRPEDIVAFKDKMRVLRGNYPNLRLGLCGDLNLEKEPAAAGQGEAAEADSAPCFALCDRPYLDRFVTIDGYLTPCCVMTDKNEWGQTLLDRPMDRLLLTHAPITAWFGTYETRGHDQCKNCSLMSAMPAPPCDNPLKQA